MIIRICQLADGQKLLLLESCSMSPVSPVRWLEPNLPTNDKDNRNRIKELRLIADEFNERDAAPSNDRRDWT